jgi:predicted amidohydrolase
MNGTVVNTERNLNMEADSLVVGAFQGNPAHSWSQAIEIVVKVASEADEKGIDILCFPECYLTGYYESQEKAWENSVELEGDDFLIFCQLLSRFEVTVIIGLNERVGSQLYNTAVVIEKGSCIGKYRKACLYHKYFTAGREFPVFEKRGICYGVMICLDALYFEPARLLAMRGAQLIFCPMFNRMPIDHRFLKAKPPHSHFVARSFENHAWLVTADIIWENDGVDTCPGFSSVYDNNGSEVRRAQKRKQELLIHAIPLESFKERKYKRIFGHPELFSLIQEELKCFENSHHDVTLLQSCRPGTHD